MRILKRVCFVLLLAVMPLLMAQTGPTVFTPRLTVSPGPLLVTTGNTDVQNLIIHGTCTGCVGAANFANPTGTIGLTAVNGVAATGIRSDGAPALSQAIVPTWTGIHTFSAIPAFNGGASGVSQPFSVDSNTVVTNLNADMLDGLSSGSFCQTGGTGCPSSFSGLANPTGTIGLTAVNGSATTALRSDGAPALSQAIIPTWSGAHTWTANMQQTKADPRFCQYDSGSDATWFWRESSDILRLNIVDGATCTTTGASSPIAITSAAGVVSDFALASTALTWNGSAMVNVASSPTWTGSHTFTLNPTTLSNGSPSLNWTETDAPLDQKNWLHRASSSGLDICAAADATPTSCTTNFFRAVRTGLTIDTIALNSTALTWNSSAMVNVASTPTWTGQHTFTNSSGAVNLSSVNPALQWSETDQGADAKNWNLIAASGALQFQTRTDAGGAGATPISMTRSGTTVTSIALTATAATVNGSNICRADGTGCNTTGAANPTGTIGLTAVNGSATTYLRSDGAPALSQAITPTWTGLHTFDGGGVTVDDGGVRETACSLTLTGGGTFNNLDVFATCSPSGAHAILRITPDATLDSTITGMVLANNQKVTVVIPSPGTGLRAVILNNESGSSTATNRLILPSESNQCTLNRGDSFVMWKDPTSDRVRIMNGDGYVCGA